MSGAHAACAPTQATVTNGQTVTCTGTEPNGYVAPTVPAFVTGLTVNVFQGATVTGSQVTSANRNATIRVNGDSTVNNAGTIVNNAPAAGASYGVNLFGSNTVLNNSGTITLSAPGATNTLGVYGVIVDRRAPASTASRFDNVKITNSGEISVTQNGNGVARGIYAGEQIGALTVTNTATGLISATRLGTATLTTAAVAAVDSDDDVASYTVNNAQGGRIVAAGANSRAINGRANSYVINNNGAITNNDTTAGSAAIATYAATKVLPYDTILNNNATGVITGDVRITDTDQQTAASTVVNRRTSTVTNAGIINGNLFYGNGNHTLTNTNRITGNISFLDVATAGAVAGSVNTINLGTGSVIGGNILAQGLGTNNLNLGGTGTFTSSVTGFTNITQTDGAWTIGNNSVQTISGNLTVAGGNLTLATGTTQNVGGLIQVTGSGAQLTVNNTITNKAVNLSGSNTTLVNNGTITRSDLATTTNTTANRQYGVISSAPSGSSYANVSVINNGTISVTENGAARAQAVYAGERIASMMVTNNGTISATRSATATGTQTVSAVDSDDDVTAYTVNNRAGANITATGTGTRAIRGAGQSYTINNEGTITGPAGGDAIATFAATKVFVYNTVLTNTGTINGNVRNTDVDNQTAASTPANRRSGTITNSGTINGSLFFGRGNQTIVNTGTITGNLNFLDIATAGAVAGSVNKVTLGTGSVVNGDFIAQGLGNNALTLTGTGTLNSNVSGFTTLSQADGTWTLASGKTQAFSGGASVTGGSLTVNSTLNANTGVGSAGTLGGTGTIGGNLTNAGLVAPGTAGGTPNGTLSVTGNYVQQASGTLSVKAATDGSSDKLAANGTASLDGAVFLNNAPGVYLPGTRYTVLTAATGVSGTFASASARDLPFLIKPVASTDATNAYVTLQQQSFANVAQTPNQANAARGLDAALANNPAALAALDYQSNQAIAGILDRASGQAYASVADPQLRSGRAFGDQLVGRGFAALFEPGATGFTLPPATYAADLPNRGPVPEPRFVQVSRGYGVWATGYGQFGSVDSTANAAGRHETVAGLATGVDFRPSAGTVLGIAAGYGSVDVSVNRTAERAHTDNAQVGIYGGFVSGGLYGTAAVGYAHTDGRVDRALNVAALQPNGARGNISGDQFLSAGELGYRYSYAPGQVFSPFVGYQVATFSQDRVNEGVGGLFNLNVASKDFLSARSLVGGRAESSLDVGGRTFSIGVKVAYVHDFADVSRTISSSFVLAPAVPFAVSGLRLDRDRALVGVGASTVLAPGLVGTVNYDAELAGSDTIQAVRGGLRYSF